MTSESVMTQAAADVLAERRRQVEAEGWTPEHDDEHDKCEMAVAAACYATAPSPVRIEREWTYPDEPKAWPWHHSWWKPGFYRHNLVKAGALILAEIERWDRASGVTALAPSPLVERISVGVQRMDTSAGPEFYTQIKCGDRATTPFRFRERFKAAYEADHLAWIFGLRPDEPDLMAYDEVSHPNTPEA